MNPMTLIDGEATDLISVNDRGLQFGDGLFETIRTHGRKIYRWERHLDRLRDGCARLGIEPIDSSLLLDDARRILDSDTDVLKIILTRGASERGYSTSEYTTTTRIVRAFKNSHSDRVKEGIDLGISEQRLPHNIALAGIKHLNRLDNVLARMRLDPAADEAVMLDGEGNVIEGIMSNIFIVRDGRLITPGVDRCGVSGVTRGAVLDLAAHLGIDTSIATVSIEDLDTADEIFLCNSLTGIRAVSTFARRRLASHELTHQLSVSLEVWDEEHVTHA